jgi:SOS response regulatory protein OraA/RecX
VEENTLPLHSLSNFNSDGSSKKRKVSNLGVSTPDTVEENFLEEEPTKKKFKKIENMTFDEQVDFAKESILNYLTMAPRTKKQLLDKLVLRGYSAEAIATALARMEEVGIVNDSEFAKLWVSARRNNAKLAPYAIKRELTLKGVEEDIIEDALSDITEESLFESARAIALNKIKIVKGDKNAKVSKIASAIARKGYSSSIAFAVAKEVVSEHGENLDDMFLDSGEQ